MGFGDQIKKRADLLRKREEDVGKAMEQTSRVATMAAIDAAKAKTPPPKGALRGTGMVSGDLAQQWDVDSSVTPVGTSGGAYATLLANTMHYASYVNNGHRVDKHFVPGLIINEESGLLERSPDGKGGIVVGTKTQYVPGSFMLEAGIDAFEDTARKHLLKIARDAFRD